MTSAAAIFDLDGTLLDTLEDIAITANKILSDQGFPIFETDRYRHFVGNGVEVLFQRCLPEQAQSPERLRECVQKFKPVYEAHYRDHSRPYPGIMEMLDALRTMEIPFAVLSNKPDAFTKQMVKEFFPGIDFKAVLGARLGVPHKPSPVQALEIAESLGMDPRQISFLGDSNVDIETANRASMHSVGALWGFRDEEELKMLARTHSFECRAKCSHFFEPTSLHHLVGALSDSFRSWRGNARSSRLNHRLPIRFGLTVP